MAVARWASSRCLACLSIFATSLTLRCVSSNGPVKAEDAPNACRVCGEALFDSNSEPIRTVARFKIADWLLHLLRYPNMGKYLNVKEQNDRFYRDICVNLADGDELIAGGMVVGWGGGTGRACGDW